MDEIKVCEEVHEELKLSAYPLPLNLQFFAKKKEEEELDDIDDDDDEEEKEEKDGDSDATDGGDGEGPDEGEMPVEITWFYYDEWDFRAADYKPRWCRVQERPLEEALNRMRLAPRLEPDALVLLGTELWPGLLRAAASRFGTTSASWSWVSTSSNPSASLATMAAGAARSGTLRQVLARRRRRRAQIRGDLPLLDHDADGALAGDVDLEAEQTGIEANRGVDVVDEVVVVRRRSTRSATRDPSNRTPTIAAA